jgi:hypothetical protein
MPQLNKSRIEKDKVWGQIEVVAGKLTPAIGYRQDWRINKNGSLSVLVSFSKTGQLFYDVSHADFNRWSNFERAFIVFVVGSHKDVLVVLAKDLERRIRFHGLTPSEEYGDYKLHLANGAPPYLFRELPDFRLTEFHNYYDLLRAP